MKATLCLRTIIPTTFLPLPGTVQCSQPIEKYPLISVGEKVTMIFDDSLHLVLHLRVDKT